MRIRGIFVTDLLMAGCCIFTACGIRSNFGKTGEPPEDNNGLMDLCTLSITPSDVYYDAFVRVFVCVHVHAQNHGCEIDLSHHSAPHHARIDPHAQERSEGKGH